MSRIQDILNKAERDGTARRTRALSEQAVTARVAPVPPAYQPPPASPQWSAAPSTQLTAGATAAAFDPESVATVVPTLDPRLVAAIAPQSLAAEQYRSLRTRIQRAQNGRAVRTIVMTSPSKGDGKSLTAANLALTMAQEFHQRVLLVDGDLRRPSVARLFGITDGPGLADVLTGAADLDAALLHLGDLRLTLLPAGTLPGHPAELLGSTGMRRVLDTLRTRFDRILIDMPPVAPLADVQVVAPMADGIVMVVRAGVTEKPAIERALSGLDMAKVLGLVLNEAGAHGGDTFNYAGYGYVAD
jgi:protein-tyrosine kinase